MNNYKKNKLTALRVAIVLKFGYINEWLNTHIFPTRIIEKDLYIEEMQPIVQVVDPSDDGYVNHSSSEQPNSTTNIFDYIPEEVRQQVIEGDKKVCQVFTDSRFLYAINSGVRDYIIQTIALLYYQDKIDYDLYRALVEPKVIEPSEDDVKFFKSIGLIPIQNGTGGGGAGLS